MQNRYAGDIGDYIKLALLRHLSVGKNLGIAWYLHPDENLNSDGKHTSYLTDKEKWRPLDPELFDTLTKVVSKTRSIAALQTSGMLNAVYWSEPLAIASVLASKRCDYRSRWFNAALKQLKTCNLIFADPDNGIIDDGEHRRRQPTFGKQMPLFEVLTISNSRTAIIYHHNTRFKGGHDAEVDHWLAQLGPDAIAVRANAYSCRTFFIVNPDIETKNRAEGFCKQWSDHKVRLHLSLNDR